MPGTSYISGLISGIDIDAILSKLLEVSQAPITRLQSQQTNLNTQLSAWQTANTRLLALKTAAGGLARLSAFEVKTAASSNEGLLTASASASAPTGVYALTVNSVATFHQLVSQGYADADVTSLGSGTVSLQVGDQPATTLNVDNLTLSGLRDLINNADLGVHAALINDGSSATPWRLVLTSASSGTAGKVTVTSSLSGGAAPTFGDLRPAQDASLTLGSGAGAITITKGSNSIDDVIPGVTLYLHAADAGQTVTLTIGNDTNAVKKAIHDFADQFNSLMDYVNQQFAWDAKTEKGGTLFGNFTLQQIQSDLRDLVSNVLAGTGAQWVVLSQIGITTNADDKLVIDDTKLDAALGANVDDVAKLFARFGQPSDPHVGFINATADTRPSGSAGYAVEITQAATKSHVTAGMTQDVALAADETLTVNGVQILLTAGMTQDQVAAAVNAHSDETGVVAARTGADGTGTGNYLTLANTGYGSADLAILSSTSNAGGSSTTGVGNVQISGAAPAGESGGGQGAAGLAVQGTIGGEAAQGYGQLLVGTAGASKGLSVLVTATAAGSYGSVVYSPGVAGGMDGLLDFLTTSDSSPIQTAQHTLQERIDGITKEITDLQQRVAAQQERIRLQFQNMEQAMGRLQSQSQFLTQQLQQINSNWRGA
jgi:flagellar hook-associated protein 2